MFMSVFVAARIYFDDDDAMIACCTRADASAGRARCARADDIIVRQIIDAARNNNVVVES